MKAVVVVDMLNEFVLSNLKCDGAAAVLPKVKLLVEAAREKNVPVIFANDSHLPRDDGLVNKTDFLIPKRYYSGFRETRLENLLRELGVDTLIICGIHTHICVRHTAADAVLRGFRIVIPQDCVAAYTEKDHQDGLTHLKTAYEAEIKKTEEVIESL